MRARYTRRALADIEHIFAYLDERSPAGAVSIKKALRRAIQPVETFPSGGQLSDWKGLRQRPVSPYPYTVYWKVEGEEVWVVHIRHAARRRPE
jgi:toxin ParE1/3/4